MLTKDAAFDKVRKYLEFGESSNPQVIGIGLHQAHGFMKKYCLTLPDDEQSTIGSSVCAGVRAPTMGIQILLDAIARAFHCSCLTRPKEFIFVGAGTSHEFAALCFHVVRYKLESAWKERLQLPDAKFVCKTQKASMKLSFELGFAKAVRDVVCSFAEGVSDETAQEHCEKLSSLLNASFDKARQGRTVNQENSQVMQYLGGMTQGKTVRINRQYEARNFTLRIA